MNSRFLIRPWLFALAVYILAVQGEVALKAATPPSSAEELRTTLDSALRGGNVPEIESLVYWHGVADKARDQILNSEIKAMVKRGVTSVTISALPNDFQLVRTNEASGFYTKLSISPSGLIHVKSADGHEWRLPYGKTNDRYWIAGTVIEGIPGSSLCVNVLVGPNADSISFTGSWIYVRGGKEFEVGFSNLTNRFEKRWGDYIKSCALQRAPGKTVQGFDNWLYFQIIENGTNVYESPEIASGRPFIYNRK